MAIRKSRIVLLTVVVAIILIIVCFLDFRKQVDRYIEADMFSQIEATQESSILLIRNEMSYLKHMTASMAQMMSHADIETDEDILQMLREYTDMSDIVRTFFITIDGHVYSNYAGDLGKHDETATIDGIPISQITDTIFSQPYYVKELDEAVIGVAAPTTAGANQGILVSTYKVSELSSLLENKLIGESAELGIVNRKGQVINSRSNDDFMINIFDGLSKVQFIKSSGTSMQDDFESGRSGVSVYKVKGAARYCSYRPIGENNWYFIMTVGGSALRSKLANFEQYGIQLVVKLVIIMLGLLCVIIVNWMVEQRKIMKILEDTARQDGLTGIYNRKAIEEMIEQYLLASKEDVCAVLLVIDIDDFKKINDEKGHLFGDNVLRECANRLNRMFGYDGLVGRIGGDEFVAFLYDSGSTSKLEERINKFIHDFYVITDTGVKQTVSISVGIAHARAEVNSFHILYQLADAALYRAKQSGKAKFSE